ncbi:MAG: SH3 domain-containing protein, partial [Clostridia bacterium]|nr:SH3 domain-containing protein [Clostridia bacterium]
MGKRLTALLLCLALLATLCVAAPASAGAEGLGVVITVNDPLNVREGPGSQYTRLGEVPKGATVTLLDTSNSGWYLIRYGNLEGYAAAQYIRIVPTEPDGDFEAYLTEQGFPESYKPGLRTLHALHPNWVFLLRQTGLTWNEVVNAECAPGHSLYPLRYCLGSELSYEQGTYNFDTGEHIVFDSGGWVTASRELVAYALDPRNYLSETHVFAFLSMSYAESETYEGVASIVKNTFLANAYPSGLEDSNRFATWIDAILTAARETGMSAYHLAAYIKQEQGSGGTELAWGTMSNYPGYYNLLNIGAYQDGALSARQRGARTAYQKGWNTPYKAILGGAQFLVSGYINVGQNNIYFKKFDLIADGGLYNHQYMGNIKAVFTEAEHLHSAYTDIGDARLTFEVPVLLDMPETAAPKPTATGSNNNVLRGLSVEGQTLTPSFDKYGYTYDLVVDTAVSAITVTADPYDATARVSGAGTVALAQGSNRIDVVVTAASGTTRTYTLSVYRQPGAGGDDPPVETPPSIVGAFNVGTYITGVAPETSVSDFLARLGVQNGDAVLQAADGSAKTEGLVATGDRVVISQSGAVKLTYSVVIYGDVNRDGRVSTTDLFLGQRYILHLSELSAEQTVACDMDHNGNISTVDLFLGQRHIL